MGTKLANGIIALKSPNPTSIGWIEILPHTPIADNRRYCIWCIPAPYLVKGRRLSDESYFIVISWLERYSLLNRLSFEPRRTYKEK